MLLSFVDRRDVEASDVVEVHDEQRVVIEVNRHVPESHHLVNEPVELVPEAAIAPEPDLVADWLIFEVQLVRVFTNLTRVRRAGRRVRDLEELALHLGPQQRLERVAAQRFKDKDIELVDDRESDEV